MIIMIFRKKTNIIKEIKKHNYQPGDILFIELRKAKPKDKKIQKQQLQNLALELHNTLEFKVTVIYHYGDFKRIDVVRPANQDSQTINNA